MGNEKYNGTVSEAKLAANRTNAQRSTGPRSAEGKERSSRNAWRHGFFANSLFKTPEQRADDGADYEEIVKGVFEHYRPVGFLEEYWAEKVAIETFRSVRVLSMEQEVLNSMDAFGSQSIDRILRYQAMLNRQLAKAMEVLERLRELRREKSNQGPTADAKANIPFGEEDVAGG